MAERWRIRWRSLVASRWFDPALAGALAAVGLAWLAGLGGSSSPLGPAAVILACAPVSVRRTHPVAAACLTAAAAAVAAAVTEGGPSEATAVAVVAYSCGAYARGRSGLLGVGVLLVVLVVAIGIGEDLYIPYLLLTLAPFWAGRQVRARRELVRALAARTDELEAQEDAFARLAVRHERARIARELHDVVAHHLAVMVVQAGAGRLAAPGQGTAASDRFATIGQSGRQALADMARLVDILHPHDGAGDRLRRLLDQADAGGLDLHVTPLPPDVRLPSEIEDSAYRVVQEGLTNAMKHAPGAEVVVRLAVRGDDLRVEITDGGGTAAPTLAGTGSGLGLHGMRERIESIGGDLDAGPGPGRGWSVQARLPLVAPPVTLAR